jgi:predicted XRE-type DNA-binding protein
MEKREMKDKESITTDNIFADLGLDDADEMVTRSDLMSEVVSLIRNSDLSQKEIAKILGISAPKVSALMKGKINDFSNETLMNYLAHLGCDLEIRVTPKKRVSGSVKRGTVRVKRSISSRKNKVRNKNISPKTKPKILT